MPRTTIVIHTTPPSRHHHISIITPIPPPPYATIDIITNANTTKGACGLTASTTKDAWLLDSCGNLCSIKWFFPIGVLVIVSRYSTNCTATSRFIISKGVELGASLEGSTVIYILDHYIDSSVGARLSRGVLWRDSTEERIEITGSPCTIGESD
ncbi:hypothetical protein Tco_0901910 [Tanacetum coccineum]